MIYIIFILIKSFSECECSWLADRDTVILEETLLIWIGMFHHRIKIISQHNTVLICSDFSLQRRHKWTQAMPARRPHRVTEPLSFPFVCNVFAYPTVRIHSPNKSEAYLCSFGRPRPPRSRLRRSRTCRSWSWCSRSGTGAHGRATRVLQVVLNKRETQERVRDVNCILILLSSTYFLSHQHGDVRLCADSREPKAGISRAAQRIRNVLQTETWQWNYKNTCNCLFGNWERIAQSSIYSVILLSGYCKWGESESTFLCFFLKW